MNIFLSIVVLAAQKTNHLIETFLLRTHNTRFGLEIRKLNFNYALIYKGQLTFNIRPELLFCEQSDLVTHMGESFQDYSLIQDFEADFL